MAMQPEPSVTYGLELAWFGGIEEHFGDLLPVGATPRDLKVVVVQ